LSVLNYGKPQLRRHTERIGRRNLPKGVSRSSSHVDIRFWKEMICSSNTDTGTGRRL